MSIHDQHRNDLARVYRDSDSASARIAELEAENARLREENETYDTNVRMVARECRLDDEREIASLQAQVSQLEQDRLKLEGERERWVELAVQRTREKEQLEGELRQERETVSQLRGSQQSYANKLATASNRVLRQQLRIAELESATQPVDPEKGMNRGAALTTITPKQEKGE